MVMSNGLAEKIMQAKRINTFSCLTLKKFQYFGFSDMDNGCVS